MIRLQKVQSQPINLSAYLTTPTRGAFSLADNCARNTVLEAPTAEEPEGERVHTVLSTDV